MGPITSTSSNCLPETNSQWPNLVAWYYDKDVQWKVLADTDRYTCCNLFEKDSAIGRMLGITLFVIFHPCPWIGALAGRRSCPSCFRDVGHLRDFVLSRRCWWCWWCYGAMYNGVQTAGFRRRLLPPSLEWSNRHDQSLKEGEVFWPNKDEVTKEGVYACAVGSFINCAFDWHCASPAGKTEGELNGGIGSRHGREETLIQNVGVKTLRKWADLKTSAYME